MPPRKKAVSSGGSEDDEYRKKRDRNNKAVQRSRVKSKQRTSETKHRVQDLRVKNQVLEENIKTYQKDLKFLKDLFLTQAQAKSETMKNVDLKELLKDDDDDDDDEKKSGKNGESSSASRSRKESAKR